MDDFRRRIDMTAVNFAALLAAAHKGNFATLDPATNTNSGVLSGGNLAYAGAGASGNIVRSTLFSVKQPIYVEATASGGTFGTGNNYVGVVQQAQATSTPINLAS